MQKLHYHLRRRSHELVDALYANSGLHIRGDYHGQHGFGGTPGCWTRPGRWRPSGCRRRCSRQRGHTHIGWGLTGDGSGHLVKPPNTITQLLSEKTQLLYTSPLVWLMCNRRTTLHYIGQDRVNNPTTNQSLAICRAASNWTTRRPMRCFWPFSASWWPLSSTFSI